MDSDALAHPSLVATVIVAIPDAMSVTVSHKVKKIGDAGVIPPAHSELFVGQLARFHVLPLSFEYSRRIARP